MQVLIDDHCHPFSLEPGPLRLERLTLDVEDAAGAEMRAEVLPTSVFQELLVQRLAQRLACEPPEVVAARAEAATAWDSYVRALFADAGLSALVMDPAYPPIDADAVAVYEKLSGCSIHLLHRIDPVIDGALEKGAPADDVVEAVVSSMERAASGGAVGFKTVIAYRTGLDVSPDAGIEDARRSLEASADLPLRRQGKALRDLVLRRALGVAADLGLPFQIHTGFGETDIRLREADPLLLEELLRTPEGKAARVVLIHGSFPYHEEVGFLANRPNVYVDVSLFNIFAPLGVAERILRIIDVAPTAKVLFGTDAFNEPELFWFGAVVLREAWEAARVRLAEAGAGSGWIEESERAMFEGNARRLYGL